MIAAVAIGRDVSHPMPCDPVRSRSFPSHPMPSRFGGRSIDHLQSLLGMILEQFEDRLVQILLAVAVLSGVLSAFEDDPHVRRVAAVSGSFALAAALALACRGLIADCSPACMVQLVRRSRCCYRCRRRCRC